MPHLTTFDSFTAKSNFYEPEGVSKRSARSGSYSPSREADGFMKLDDIRGEVFVTWREDGAGRFTGKQSNWDAICDVGTAIKQTSVADALTNYRLNGDADHNGLTSDITLDPKTGVINGPLINPIIDPNETYDVAIQSLIGDMMTGFMKLNDIRGEFAPSRKYVTHSAAIEDRVIDATDNDANDSVFQLAQFTTGGGGDSFNSWRDVRDHNHGKFAQDLTNAGQEGYTEVEWTYLKGNVWTNGSATSIREGITGFGVHVGLANGAVHPDTPMDTHPNDILLGFPGSGADALTNYRPEVFSEGVSSPAGYTDIIPAIALRSDNRFVIEPVKLFQGLDAGNAPDSPLINPDSLSNPHNFLPYTVDGEGNNP